MKSVAIFVVELLALGAALGVIIALPIEVSAWMASPAQPVRAGEVGLAAR